MKNMRETCFYQLLINKSFVKVIPIFMLVTLASCGGGGGGSSSNVGTPSGVSTPPVADSVATQDIVFEPKAIDTAVLVGKAAEFNFEAVVLDDKIISDIELIRIVDVRGILSGGLSIFKKSDDEKTYGVVASISKSLPVGQYSGNLTVEFCKNKDCTIQTTATPVIVPYDIAVLAQNTSTYSFTTTPPGATAQVVEGSKSKLKISLNGADIAPDPIYLSIFKQVPAVDSPGKMIWISDKAPVKSTRINKRDFSINMVLPDNIPAGRYKGIFVAEVVRDGVKIKELSIPYDIRFNPEASNSQRMTLSDWGVAFVSTPLYSRLNKTVTVDAAIDFGDNIQWIAKSDSPWLSVTASGDTRSNNKLNLTADSSTLPIDTVSYAKVTISTGSGGVEPAVFKVGLWKSSTNLQSPLEISIPSNPFPGRAHNTLTADPIRPYFYVNDGRGSIEVFNAHTGKNVGKIFGVGDNLGNMAVSPDGDYLYVMDLGKSSIAVVDLLSQKKIIDLPDANIRSGINLRLSPLPEYYYKILAIRPRGVDVILNGFGGGYVKNKSGYAQSGNLGLADNLTATSSGRTLYVRRDNHSGLEANDSISIYSVDSDGLKGGRVHFSLIGGKSINRAFGFAINSDATKIFAAETEQLIDRSSSLGNVYTTLINNCTSLDPGSMSRASILPGSEGAGRVKTAWDGRPTCIRFDPTGTNSNPKSIFSNYDLNGLKKSEFRISGKYGPIGDSGDMISADGTVFGLVMTNVPSTLDRANLVLIPTLP